ncbi:MAG: GNAT family N-acetyltransferase [Candidatus Eisenbacteria bacterium]|nr:GNAT family N-acetyltransferase [Candidatus Eisenbacteria bacterium]
MSIEIGLSDTGDTASGPAYRVETTRLVLRCWEPRDAPLLKAAVDASAEHLRTWMPWVTPEPEPLETKIQRLRRFRGDFDQGRDFVYGIFSSDESRVLGGSGLHTRLGEGVREIGYWIHVDFVNQGLATEVSAALTRVAFEVDRVHRVEIHIREGNGPSEAVPRKLGYRHEATLGRRLTDAEGVRRAMTVWTLFDTDYPSSVCAGAPIRAFDVVGRRLI